ncbi:hypothetical protein [Streptomyces clavuligerus]|uniref:hypothetical protein n=1 Tax=Streptomyces clavuligerus TaxID=1901 RepID=UPI00020D92CE|nr:hypothetical protein [Streptomyces clavuligerus]WDN56025.1 hypothetical protein LL058_29515 [Streptomyces clavuligerus]
MTGTRPALSSGPACEVLLELEERLGALRHDVLDVVRFAAAILQPAVPGTEPPPFPRSTERLLQLMTDWREAALELGEFAPHRH